MEAFNLKNQDSFFGREDLYSNLMFAAKRGEPILVMGARRFGKTRLFEKCYDVLISDKNLNIIPVMFDAKTDDIRGDAETYRYIVSKLIVSIINYLGTINKDTIEKISINYNNPKWSDVFEQLEASNISKLKLRDILEDLIKSTDKKILFIFDEYEYLLNKAFSSSNAFMIFRRMATKREYGFSYWVAGSANWDTICESEGSGEFNGGTTTWKVNKISKGKFVEMWRYECSLIEDVNDRKRVFSKCDLAYNQSGGIPFYGKMIGLWYLQNKNKDCDYTYLSAYFNEIVSKLPLNECEYLKVLSQNLTSKYIGTVADRLIEKGLVIKTNGNECCIAIQFLKDYVYNLTLSEQPIVAPTQPIQSVLAKRIESNISFINTEYKNKKGLFLLPPINGLILALDELSKICSSIADYKVFSTTIYTYWYERCQKCQESIIKNKYDIIHSDFMKIIDTNRHTLGGAHLEDTFVIKDPMKRKEKDKMLETLVGSKSEPCVPSDFEKLQLAILNLFDKEVENLLNDVRSMS